MSRTDEKIVVTGLGCISALGHSVDEFWTELKEGRSGIRPLNIDAPVELKVSVGGAIPAPDVNSRVNPKLLPMLDRFSVLALIAAEEAIKQAGLSFEGGLAARTGCILGVGVAGWEAIEDSYRRILIDGAKRTNVFTVPRAMPGAPPSQISMAHHLLGPVFSVSSACASSNHALGTALTLLRAGVSDVILAGGTEAPLIFGILKAWDALRVLAPDTCRPFDKNRKGLALAEGAGVAVLERESHAKARGATIIAEIAGFGMSADAADLVAPTVEGPAAAMRACLADAGLTPDMVDYINAHGTGTAANDITELTAIKAAFGEHAKALSVSSTKSMHGHALGASGALELIATIKAVTTGIVPPTANIEELDPACDLDVTPITARERPVRAAISNAFAFGGTNAVIAVTPYRG